MTIKDFEHIELNDLTFEQKVELYKSKVAIIRLFTEIEKEIVNTMLLGEDVAGYKLKPSFPRPTIIDIDKLYETIHLYVENKEDLYTSNPKTPTQIKKIVTTAIMEEGSYRKKECERQATALMKEHINQPGPSKYSVAIDEEVVK